MKIFRFILLLGLFGCLQVICSEGSDSDSDGDAFRVKSPNIVYLGSYATAEVDALHALEGLPEKERRDITDQAMIAARVDLEDLEPAFYQSESIVEGVTRHLVLHPDAAGDKYLVGYGLDGRRAFFVPSEEDIAAGAGYDLVGMNKFLTEEAMRLATARAKSGKASVKDGKSIKSLPCGHVYHSGCIKSAFALCGRMCPACTVPVKRKQIGYVNPKDLPKVRDRKCYDGSSVECFCGTVIVGARFKGSAVGGMAGEGSAAPGSIGASGLTGLQDGARERLE